MRRVHSAEDETLQTDCQPRSTERALSPSGWRCPGSLGPREGHAAALQLPLHDGHGVVMPGRMIIGQKTTTVTGDDGLCAAKISPAGRGPDWMP